MSNKTLNCKGAADQGHDGGAKADITTMKRRSFFKVLGAATAAASAPTLFVKVRDAYAKGVPAMDRSGTPDAVETDTAKTKFVYSVCLQCHSACGIRGKVDKATDTVLSIQGNPFHPNNVEEDENRLEMGKVKIDDPSVLKTAGTICPKGLASVEIMYNPYRILTPLKRVGPRGSGKWVSITYAKAIEEIAAKILPYWTDGPNPAVSQKKDEWYIDPNNKSLGWKNNQVALSIGRLEHGQKEFTDRWFKYGFGSTNNRLDHTSICETSHHVGLEMVFGNSGKHHTKPDFRKAKVVLAIGANLFEAGFPAQAMSRKIARAIKENNLQMAIADPRFSKAAAKAKWWLPVVPGGDAALCFAIMKRWFDKTADFEKDGGVGVNTTFLRNATKGAAEADDDVNVSDATWLVRRDNGAFYKDKDDNLMVWSGGKAVSISKDPHKSADKIEGTLLTDKAGVKVDNVVCDSVFALVYDYVSTKTVADWAALCGVDTAMINEVADALSAAGVQGGVEFYRGPVQHTNGTYNALACAMLNTLRGNYDHEGGVAVTGGGHWHEMGGKTDGQLSIGSPASGKYAYTGPRVDRAKADFSKYKGADTKPKRPWFPFAYYGVWQEVIPSIGDAYPYAVKALFSYWANPLYTTPGARVPATAVLLDESKLPLHVSMDNSFGETASLADYIIPDTTFLERWSTPHTAPVNFTSFSGFRQPMAGKYKDPANPKFDEFQAAVGDCWQYEDIWIGMALKLSELANRPFPGIGKDGLAPGKDLYAASQWYDQIAENFALEHNDKTGMKITKQDVFDHGGAFSPPGTAEYEKVGANSVMKARFKFKKPVHMYIEALALTPDWKVDGSKGKWSPIPVWEPIRDVLDNNVEDDQYQWPFLTVTYKAVQHKMAVTAVCPTLMMLEPENFVEMNASDGRALGLETGDLVLVQSPTNLGGVKGKVKLTETIRPGVIAASMGFGSWESSTKPHMLDGKPTGFDPRRGKGVNFNAVQRLDPVLKDVVLQDKIGGSSSYSQTRVRVTKVGS